MTRSLTMWSRSSFLSLVLLAPLGGQAATVSLKAADLRSRIEGKNPQVQAQQKRAEGAVEGHLSRAFLPQLELRAAQENFKKGQRENLSEPSWGAEMRVNLYNAGRDSMKEESLSKRRERSLARLKLTTSEELAKARESYYRLLYLRDSVAIFKEVSRRNDDNARAAERRVRSGVGLQTDRIEFEMKAVELRQTMERTELERRSEARRLALRLGLSEDTSFDLPEVLDHEHDWETSLNLSGADQELRVKPLLLEADEGELLARREGRGWWPRVDAYAGWNQFNQREEDGTEALDRRESVVGLRMTMDLFDGFRSRPEASALKADAVAARIEATDQKNHVTASLTNEREELRLLHNQIHEADENVRRAEKYAELTQSEYSRGVKNSPDVLGATGKVFEMKMRRLEILRDFQTTRGLWLSTMGL